MDKAGQWHMDESSQPGKFSSCYRQPAAPTHAFESFPLEEIESSIPCRFEKLALRYSGRLAVRCRQRSYTYAELNIAANRIAHAILQRSETSNEPVIVLLEQGALAIAAIFGVLKSGKAYVPLDPSDPPARLAYMIKDAQASLILTDEIGLAAANHISLSHVSWLDVGSLDSHLPKSNPPITTAPTQHANIIYTSGSTGTPKGVLQNHRNLLFEVRRVTSSFRIRPDDRLALVHSCNTAASLRRIFPALLNGASLHLLNFKAERLEAVAQWFVDEEITISNARWLLRDCAPFLTGENQFPRLRLVTYGGEATYRRDIELCRRYLSPTCVVLINLCTTETGSDRQYFLDRTTSIRDTLLPVGYATEGTDVLLLDDDGQEVPLGQVGEIAIRSRYLSLGYWQKPELTQQRFLVDSANDARIYLTGDVGRLDADGCLFHLGRKDFQVKIRGHRIEALEVEQALLSLGEFKEAIVFAHATSGAEDRLAACLIPIQPPAPSIGDIRRRLAETLPEHMIPSIYALLDSFPRLPSGKVDRKELVAQFAHIRPWRDRPNIGVPFVAPGNALEEIVAGIWSDVLDIEPIGVHDAFLDLGGNSLMAARVTSQICSTFEVQFPVRLLFDHPTIAQLGTAISAALKRRDQHGPPPIRPVARTALPLSCYQERTWRNEKDNPRNLEIRQFHLRGELHVDALQQALSEIVRRHEVLRTNYREHNGVVHQAIAPSSSVEIPVFELSSSQESELQQAQRSLTTNLLRPMDLARDAIVRASLLRLGGNEYRLFLAIHHIALDGLSLQILFSEWDVLYRAFSQGRPSPLPPIAVQYADYAIWQRGWLNCNSTIFRGQLDYWKFKLGAAPPPLELPRRLVKPRTPDLDNCLVQFELPNNLSAQLIALSRRANTTLFATLLASFKAALQQRTTQPDILVGTYTGARTHLELVGLIGYFVNLLPLHTSISAKMTFLDVLARVRETTLDAYSHADLPFEELCAALQRAGCQPPEVRLIFELKESEYEQNIAGVEVRRIRKSRPSVMPWGMTVKLTRQQQRLSGRVSFDSDLYDPQGVRQLTEDWIHLLKKVAQEPNQRLSQLEVPRRRHAA